MKRVKIGLVHATLNSLQPIVDAFREQAPDTKLLHFMDEGLIDELNESGQVSPAMVRRLVQLVEKAEERNVDVILLTCSSFSPFVEEIRPLFRTPMLAADISMLEEAVNLGKRIGVIATVEAAGPTTEALLYKLAEDQGKEIIVNTIVRPEAFEALQQGKVTEHNVLIQTEIQGLAPSCDVIVLAQMSMTRAKYEMPSVSIPVLTSPEISVRAVLTKVLS